MWSSGALQVPGITTKATTHTSKQGHNSSPPFSSPLSHPPTQPHIPLPPPTPFIPTQLSQGSQQYSASSTQHPQRWAPHWYCWTPSRRKKEDFADQRKGQVPWEHKQSLLPSQVPRLNYYLSTEARLSLVRAQELCESWGCCPVLPVPNTSNSNSP